MLPLPHLFPQLELSPPKCPMPVVYSEPHAKPSFCSFIKPGEMDGGAERFFFRTGCLLWNPLSQAQHFHALPYRQWQCKQKLRHLPAAANWPWDSVHNELHRHKNIGTQTFTPYTPRPHCSLNSVQLCHSILHPEAMSFSVHSEN